MMDYEIYRNELIEMYASLEKTPVVVSYPDGQPSKFPKNKEEKWRLNNFMCDNRFETIYTFGPCKIIHYVPALIYRPYGVQELRFYNNTNIKNVDFASLRYYHQTDEVEDHKKPLMQLYKDVKSKLRGKPFTNPIESSCCGDISELQLYATHFLDNQQMDLFIAQLEQINKMLMTKQYS